MPPFTRSFAATATKIALALALTCATVHISAQTLKSDERWVGTWSAAVMAPAPAAPGRGPAPGGAAVAPAVPGVPPAATPAPAPAATLAGAPTVPPPPGRALNNQTLRLIVHTTIGGSRVRVVLSNAFGTVPLDIGAAHVALHERDEAIAAKSARVLSFSGRSSVKLPAGASIVSDPVAMTIAPLSDLVVDIYVPGDTVALGTPVTYHATGLQTSYISTPGNFAGSETFPISTNISSWYLLSRIEVVAPAKTGVIVAIGDSITDGSRSTANTNNRWPDLLAKRLAEGSGPRMAVLNVGIGGNRVLLDGSGPNALARFDRDVLAQPGVTHVIVLEGINDIGNGRANPSPSAADLIAGHRQLIERAHAHGIKIIGATLTPYEGAGYFTPEGEAKRSALNEWIRTSKEYDGVIDFDRASRDPAQPTKFLPIYQSGDWLHPNDAGFQAMVKAIDLSLFGVKAKD